MQPIFHKNARLFDICASISLRPASRRLIAYLRGPARKYTSKTKEYPRSNRNRATSRIFLSTPEIEHYSVPLFFLSLFARTRPDRCVMHQLSNARDVKHARTQGRVAGEHERQDRAGTPVGDALRATRRRDVSVNAFRVSTPATAGHERRGLSMRVPVARIVS